MHAFDIVPDSLYIEILKGIKFSMGAVSGFWEGDYEKWDAIVAVCNLESLLAMGVSLDETWLVTETSTPISLKNIISYLNKQVSVDESGVCLFGEDIWDLFRLVNMIESWKLQEYFTQYKQIANYCKQIVEKEAYNITTEWEGPGVKAVAYIYARNNNLIQHEALKSSLMEERNKNYTWGNSKSKQKIVWHTSQVVSAISRFKDGTLDNIDKSLKAIYKATISKEFQNNTFLKMYYLCYAALAFIYSNHTHTKEFKNLMQEIINYIKKRPDNKKIERGDFSMIAELFSALLIQCPTSVNINCMLRAGELEDTLHENCKLKNDMEELKKKLKDQKQYFHISKDTCALIGTIIAILTLILAVFK